MVDHNTHNSHSNNNKQQMDNTDISNHNNNDSTRTQQNIQIDNVQVSQQLQQQMDEEHKQLADFKAAHSRFREKLNSSRADIVKLSSQVAECRQEFDTSFDHLRRQVAPLLPPQSSAVRSPTVPPSTPAE